MIDVYRIHISKAEIASLPMDDRALLILAGHALNQISIFTKLVVFASNRDSSDPIEDRVNAAQTHTLLRVLYGALVETWECLRRPENQRLIGQVYLPVINTLGATAYAQLKKHFGRSRLLHALRNNFSFHFPETEMVEEAFAFVPDDEDWSWYMAEATTNSLWHS